MRSAQWAANRSALQGDLSQREAVQRIFADVMAAFGRIDVLVNNAGGAITPIERSTASVDAGRGHQGDPRRQHDERDLLLPGRGADHESAGWRRDRQYLHNGRVDRGRSRRARALRHGESRGWRNTHAISPQNWVRMASGPIAFHPDRSRRHGWSHRQLRAGIVRPDDARRIPLRRLGTTEDCANVLEFLATDLSSYVTGQCISVCGGSVLSPS